MEKEYIYILEIVWYSGTRDAMTTHTSAHRTEAGRTAKYNEWVENKDIENESQEFPYHWRNDVTFLIYNIPVED